MTIFNLPNNSFLPYWLNPGAPAPGDSSQGSSSSTEQRAIIYDLISEGPIHGLVNGPGSVYLDGTPIVDEDQVISSTSFSGVNAQNSGSSIVLNDSPYDLTELDFSSTRYISLTKTDVTSTGSMRTLAPTIFDQNSGSPGLFTTADIGKKITIAGIGPLGGDFTARIVWVFNPSVAVLNQPAETTGGDYQFWLEERVQITSASSSTTLVTSESWSPAWTGSAWTIMPILTSVNNTIDNVRNFESASYFFRTGSLTQQLPPQERGIEGTSFGSDFNDEILQSTRSGTYSITGQDAIVKNAIADMQLNNPEETDQVKIIIAFPAMIRYQKDGDKKANAVEFQIYFEYLRGTTWYNADGKLTTGTDAVPIFGVSDDEVQSRDTYKSRNTTKEKVNIWAIRDDNRAHNGVVRKKSSSEFTQEFIFDINVYKPFTNWRVRIKRVTKDEVGIKDSTQGQHKSFLTAVFATTLDKLNYPLSAYAGVGFDAKDFQQIPNRAYLCRGLKIQVPTNYITREESSTGIASYKRNITTGAVEASDQFWDGKFRGDISDTSWNTDVTNVNFNKTYCNNPAWVYYDIMVNNRYGLGEYLSSQDIGKYELYRIARYCDELVPDGVGGQEPRFTCNLYLTESQEAFKVLSDIASIFRGIVNWIDGELIATQDAPKDPIYTFTQGNIIDGAFSYESSSKRQRVNQVNVTWVDPGRFYKKTVEIVEDIEDVAQQNRIIKKDVVALGCTSQGQANRLGKWMLLTERLETRFVKFKTGINAQFLTPGDIINVQDAKATAVTASGRVSNIPSTTTVVNLDRTVTLEAGDTYKLTLIYPGTAVYLQEDSATIDGVTLYRGDLITTAKLAGSPSAVTIDTNEEAANVTDDSGNLVKVSWSNHSRLETQTVTTGSGATSTITVDTAFSAVPAANVIWSLTNITDSNINKSPIPYRVISIVENEDHSYEIGGHEYIRAKFDAIDRGYDVAEINNAPIPQFDQTSVPPPTNLKVDLSAKSDGNAIEEDSLHFDLFEVEITWNTPLNPNTNDAYPFAQNFEIKHNFTTDKRFITIQGGSGNLYTLNTPASLFGDNEVFVRTVNVFGRRSKWARANTRFLREAISSNSILTSRISGIRSGPVMSSSLIINQSGILSFHPSTFSMQGPNGVTYNLSSVPNVDFSSLANDEEGYLLFNAGSPATFEPVQIFIDPLAVNAASDVANVEYWKSTVESSPNDEGLTHTGSTLAEAITTVVVRNTQNLTIYDDTIVPDADLSGDFTAGDLIKLGSGSPAWYGTVESLDFSGSPGTYEIKTVEPIYKNFGVGSPGSAIYKQTYKPDYNNDFVLVKILRGSPESYTIESISNQAGTGVPSFPVGVHVGEGEMTNRLILNTNSNGSPNIGEILITAGAFRIPEGTVREFTTDLQINTPFEGVIVPPDGVFYIVWGATDATDRFPSLTLQGTAEAEGIFVALHEPVSDLWTAIGNSLTPSETFVPLDSDYIIAVGSKVSSSGGIDSLQTLTDIIQVGELDLGGIILNSWFAKQDTIRNRPAGWFVGSTTALEDISYANAAKTVMQLHDPDNADTSTSVFSTAWQLQSNVNYRIRIRARSVQKSGSENTVSFRVNELDTNLTEGLLFIGGAASYPTFDDRFDSAVSQEVTFTGAGGTEDWQSIELPTGWTEYTNIYTPTATAKWASIYIRNQDANTNIVEVDRVTVELNPGVLGGLDVVQLGPSGTVFNEAGSPLSDQDLRNDKLVTQGLGAVNFNASFQLPKDYSGTQGPAGWITNGVATYISYEDPSSNDVALYPGVNVTMNGSAMRVTQGTTYELVALVKTASSSSDVDLRCEILNTDDLGSPAELGSVYYIGSSSHAGGMAQRDDLATLVNNQSVSTTYEVITSTWTPHVTHPTAKWFSPSLYNNNSGIVLHVEWFIVTESGASTGNNFFNEAGDLLGDIDAANDVLVGQKMGPSIIANPGLGFAQPTPAGSGTNEGMPNAWHWGTNGGHAGYVDTTRDVVYLNAVTGTTKFWSEAFPVNIFKVHEFRFFAKGDSSFNISTSIQYATSHPGEGYDSFHANTTLTQQDAAVRNSFGTQDSLGTSALTTSFAEFTKIWTPPQSAKYAVLEFAVNATNIATLDWVYGRLVSDLIPRVAKTADYTVDKDDASWTIEVQDLGGSPGGTLTITLPNDSAIPVGSLIRVFKQGTRQTDIATAASVTMRFDDGTSGTAKTVTITNRYGWVDCFKASDTIWDVTGDAT